MRTSPIPSDSFRHKFERPTIHDRPLIFLPPWPCCGGDDFAAAVVLLLRLWLCCVGGLGCGVGLCCCDGPSAAFLLPRPSSPLFAAVLLRCRPCCCRCRRAAGLTSGKGVASVSSAGRRTPPSWPLPGGRVQPSSDIAVLLLRSTAATRRAPLTLPLLDRLRASAITSASPATRHHRLLPGHSPQSPLDPATKPPSPPPPPPLRPSDWSSIKFCQSPARLTPFRSTCEAS